MHPAGEKRGGRPNANKYTAEALESIKQDLTRFEVQNNHRNNQVRVENISENYFFPEQMREFFSIIKLKFIYSSK